jgi:hypothetical protein
LVFNKAINNSKAPSFYFVLCCCFLEVGWIVFINYILFSIYLQLLYKGQKHIQYYVCHNNRDLL